MARSIAAAPAASVTIAFDSGPVVGVSAGGIGRGKDRVIAGGGNGFNQFVGGGGGGIVFDCGTVAHKIDVGRLHSCGGAEGGFHMMLAGGAGHAEYGQRKRFCCGCGHYDSKCAVKPALATAASARSTGGGS